jgi:hypothetical protein
MDMLTIGLYLPNFSYRFHFSSHRSLVIRLDTRDGLQELADACSAEVVDNVLFNFRAEVLQDIADGDRGSLTQAAV